MSSEQIATFISITGASDKDALFYLDAAQGDVNSAVDMFMNRGSDQSNFNANDNTTGNVYNNAPQSNNVNNATPYVYTPPSSGVRTFRDISRESNVKDGENNTYYAGGEKSGIAVQGKPEKKEGDDYVKSIFEKAQENGAVDYHEYNDPEENKFSGGGFKLGNTTNQSQYVAPVPETGPIKVILTFFKDGFSVDNGEKRDFNDPSNQEFMEDINRGYIPRELEQLYPQREVHVELLDKKGEDYKEPPKPTYNSFGGHGNTLGSSQTKPVVVSSNIVEQQIVVDESLPKTQMRIRLAAGGNVTIKCNTTHTVGEIYSHLKSLNPQVTSFVLRTAYPVETLTNFSLTVEEAGLKGASLTQGV